ncbi:MAG: hypothetical protein VKN60_10530 [Cyanobacteriota bacterium]|nr:hypothetical protein [Cyanobacteriota bacterium]
MTIPASPDQETLNPLPISPAPKKWYEAKKVAVGIAPAGYIAIGVAPMGVISIGVVSMGFISIGLVSMGALAAGVVSMGMLTFGEVSMSWFGGHKGAKPHAPAQMREGAAPSHKVPEHSTH